MIKQLIIYANIVWTLHVIWLIKYHDQYFCIGYVFSGSTFIRWILMISYCAFFLIMIQTCFLVLWNWWNLTTQPVLGIFSMNVRYVGESILVCFWLQFFSCVILSLFKCLWIIVQICVWSKIEFACIKIEMLERVSSSLTR